MIDVRFFETQRQVARDALFGDCGYAIPGPSPFTPENEKGAAWPPRLHTLHRLNTLHTL